MKTTLAALACALLLLSGCAGLGDDDPAANTTPAATATATADADAASPTATASDEPRATATDAPAATPTEEDASPTATEPAAEASPTVDEGGSANAEVQAELGEVIDDTVALRGLDPTQEIPAEIISREQLSQNMMASLQEDYSQEEAAEDARIMFLLRLVEDPDLDLWQLYVDLYSERVLGYYDPEEDELFLVSDADGLSGLAEMTMAHETVHALQDQHWDLIALRPDDMEADAAAAVTALIEGDAETVGTQYLLTTMDPLEVADAIAEASTISSEVVDNAPAYVREGLYFPYTAGSEFVNALLADGGFEAVDAAFSDPPVSTEQILHPEKYLGERDDPQAVTLPDLGTALSGWELVRDDTLGEFDLRIMLDDNGAANADEAAAGWDGARFGYYTSGDRELVTMTITWDSEGDRAEFEQALRSITGAAGDEVAEDTLGRFTAVASAADGSTLIVAGTDRDAVAAALAAAAGR